MTPDLTSIISGLRNAAGARCLLLFGDDLKVQETVRTIINSLIPEAQRALNLERFDGRVISWGQVQASLITPPFFAGERVVWVENAPYFTSREQKGELGEKVFQLWADGKQEEASNLLADLLALEGWTQSDWDRLEPGAARELGGLLGAEGEEEVDRILAFCKTQEIDLSRRRGTQTESLEELLEQGLPPWAFLLMTAAQVDRRVRLYKRLDELGAVLYLGLQRNGKVSVEMLLEFIDQRMREAGKTMDSRAREMVFQRSACDLRSLSHELDKLCSYSGSRSQVRAQDVENVMTDYGEGWVFDLTRAIADRNAANALSQLLRLIARGQHPLKLLGVLVSEARQLLAGRQSLDSELRGHWRSGMSYPQFQRQVLPYSARQLTRTSYGDYMCLLRAERFSLNELRHYMDRIHDADFRLKSSGSNPRLVMERLILEMCMGEKKRLAKRPPR
jgi:DNA polymerase-3 subunit delta